MSYFPVGFVNPIPNLSLSFTASDASGTDVTVGNSYTFTSKALGAADGMRRIIVGVVLTGGATASAVTIGGVSASSIASSLLVTREHSFWIAHVPASTTGNVVVTIATATAARCFLAVYRLLSRGAPTLFDSASDSTLTAGHNDITINIKKDGVVLASTIDNVGSAPGTAWVGLTEDVDTVAPDSTTTQDAAFAGGVDTFPTAQTAYAIRATFTTSPVNGGMFAISLGGA